MLGHAQGLGIDFTMEDFHHGPMLVFYEITRACDLACKHCRASAIPKAHPDELTTAQAKLMIDQIASFPKKPVLVLTGGDPMKRADLFELITYAKDKGVNPALSPSATPLVTTESIAHMKQAGIRRLSVSLDGADAATHDGYRGEAGTFDRTLRIIKDCQTYGIPVQVNTTITTNNYLQIDAIAELLAQHKIMLWSVFFLIPVGRGQKQYCIDAEQAEKVFSDLWDQSRKQKYGIKTTEAHHYRRYMIQRWAECPGSAQEGHKNQTAPLGVNDGRGVMFVSHIGEIYPSGFMPIECGRFPHDSVVEVYQNNDLFKRLRNSDELGGKCGVCEYKRICGGSRARAFATSGDPLAAEPSCSYIPFRWRADVEMTLAPSDPDDVV